MILYKIYSVAIIWMYNRFWWHLYLYQLTLNIFMYKVKHSLQNITKLNKYCIPSAWDISRRNHWYANKNDLYCVWLLVNKLNFTICIVWLRCFGGFWLPGKDINDCTPSRCAPLVLKFVNSSISWYSYFPEEIDSYNV